VNLTRCNYEFTSNAPKSVGTDSALALILQKISSYLGWPIALFLLPRPKTNLDAFQWKFVMTSYVR
jgi:hypothetical protein